MLVQLIGNENRESQINQYAYYGQSVRTAVVRVISDVNQLCKSKQHNYIICEEEHIARMVPSIPQYPFENELLYFWVFFHLLSCASTFLHD